MENWSAEVLHCVRLEKNEDQMALSWRPLYKIALEKGNVELVNCIFKHFPIPEDQMAIADAYESMSKHAVDFTESVALLLHNIKCHQKAIKRFMT